MFSVIIREKIVKLETKKMLLKTLAIFFFAFLNGIECKDWSKGKSSFALAGERGLEQELNSSPPQFIIKQEEDNEGFNYVKPRKGIYFLKKKINTGI